MKALHSIAFLLLLVGGLNWLVFALTGWEVGALFGGMGAVVSKVIYVLVGLSAIWQLATHRNTCKFCEAKASSMPAGK